MAPSSKATIDHCYSIGSRFYLYYLPSAKVILRHPSGIASLRLIFAAVPMGSYTVVPMVV